VDGIDKVGVLWQAAVMEMVVGTLLIADYGLALAKQPLTIGGYEFALFGLSIVPFLYGAAVLCLISLSTGSVISKRRAGTGWQT
jgi:hypothetical protein